MKKNSVIKKRNAITLMVVIIIAIFLALFGIYYAINSYFEAKANQENEGLRPSFYTDENNQMDIITPSENVDKELNSLTYKISLRNKTNTLSVCKYNLYYYWDQNPEGYYSETGQLTLSGKVDDEIVFEDIILKNYNLSDLKTLLASYYIINDGGAIANQTWQINAYFHATNSESNILNMTYPGKIAVEEVSCSEGRYLKEQDIKENNYICLNSRDEFCPDDKLYQILAITKDGIKMVKTKYYGVAPWSSDLLERLSASFLDNEGKYIKNMINNHEWVLNAKGDKIVSKIGLLSLDDYQAISLNEEYLKPYVLLADPGLMANVYGLEENSIDVGYIYPVFYLKDNAIISKGDGTRGNPYFVN